MRWRRFAALRVVTALLAVAVFSAAVAGAAVLSQTVDAQGPPPLQLVQSVGGDVRMHGDCPIEGPLFSAPGQRTHDPCAPPPPDCGDELFHSPVRTSSARTDSDSPCPQPETPTPTPEPTATATETPKKDDEKKDDEKKDDEKKDDEKKDDEKKDDEKKDDEKKDDEKKDDEKKDDEKKTPPPPTPVVSIASGGKVTEGSTAKFTLTASPAPSADLSVPVTIGSTGSFGVSTGTGKLTIGTSGTVTLAVSTKDDGVDEPDGTITVTVGTGSGYTVSTSSGSATVTVADDDLPAATTVSIAGGSGITEGGTATFTLTASPAPSADLSVTVTVSQQGDFGVATRTGQVTIGTRGTATLSVPTTDDGVDEADGSVTATLGTGSGYTVSATRRSALVSVADNDGTTTTTTTPPTPTPATCATTALGTIAPTLSKAKPVSDTAVVRPVIGAWTANCFSERRPNRHAQFYTFELTGRTHVTIDLQSTARNVYLHLENANGYEIAHDDNGYPGSATDARIARVLDAGTYTVEATMKEKRKQGVFTLRVRGEFPIPNLGHQADHTVKYAFASTPPAHVANAVGTAASAWEKAVGLSWPYIVLCQSCGTKNTDGYTTTINVVSGETFPGQGSTRSVRRSGYPVIGFRDCGTKVACVKPKGVGDIGAFVRPGPGQHMKNLVMVIEDPPWEYSGKQHKGYVWTNTASQHKRPAAGGKTYRYLPATVMHEFGHTLGLDDLYNYKDSGGADKYPGYLMDNDERQTRIPAKDIAYVRQVYRNEHGSEPH